MTGMADESDWVQEVKRWVRTGARERIDTTEVDLDSVGYEAADPALQSRDWPDAPGANIGG